MTRGDAAIRSFGTRLLAFSRAYSVGDSATGRTERRVQLLLRCSKRRIRRLSAKRSVSMRAVQLLCGFLARALRGVRVPASLFVRLFRLFGELGRRAIPLPSPRHVGDQGSH